MVQHSPCTKLIGRIQRDACETILELLDGDSRFALTEEKAEPTIVAHCEHVVYTVAFTSHTGERAPDECREKESTDYGRKQWLANCLTQASEVVLRFDWRCDNLRELCCEKGIVGTPALLRMLCQKPVNKVGCSLYENHRYEPLLEKDVFADISSNYQLLTQMLEFTYTQVVGTPLKAGFLDCTLNGFLDLQRVYAHAIRKATLGLPVGDACMKFNTHIHGVRIFRYSCEQVPPTAVHLCPNVSYSYVHLSNLLEQRALLQSLRHSAVTVQTYPEAACRFLGATTDQECRYDVRSRSLVLLPSPQYIRFQRPPCVAGDCLELTRKFLHMCLANISELSLTTSHFSFVCDFCFGVVPVLSELSLLELPRRAFICQGLLQWFARGCQFLFELDVRNGDAVSCATCSLPLVFTERVFESLLWETRLWRLSIGETARIMSFTFPLCRLVTDVRFILDSLASVATSVFRGGPCHLLCVNPGLSVLTIESLRFAHGDKSDD
ncbi:uncharacterized protein [Dermacentor andersoni]|uniref:uncharacterized protein n=1 Tax=Dermacentor andersoni TaxID=34620 RepID=UPI003B3B2242